MFQKPYPVLDKRTTYHLPCRICWDKDMVKTEPCLSAKCPTPCFRYHPHYSLADMVSDHNTPHVTIHGILLAFWRTMSIVQNDFRHIFISSIQPNICMVYPALHTSLLLLDSHDTFPLVFVRFALAVAKTIISRSSNQMLHVT